MPQIIKQSIVIILSLLLTSSTFLREGCQVEAIKLQASSMAFMTQKS